MATWPFLRQQCRWRHPAFYGIDPFRNFDLVYDEEVAKLPYPFPNPLEALLYHEIIGHIVPQLMDSSWYTHPWEETERYAIERENEYRQHVGIPLVQPEMIVPKPVKRKP